MRQLILELLPEAPPSLDNFVAGGNGEALTALAHWLSLDSGEPSFVLWGEAGAGKSHLLRASGAAYHDAEVDPTLAEVDEAPLFHAVDNVEALAPPGQIALFNLFQTPQQRGSAREVAYSEFLNDVSSGRVKTVTIAGDRITGPAVIQEVTTTIVIEPGWMAELDASAVYVVTQVAEQTAPQTRRAVEVA